jgi:quinol-cytochrome oxidoreductase complex cytochrome b subunit
MIQPFHQRIVESIFPFLTKNEKHRRGKDPIFKTLLFHFRPRTVPVQSIRLTLTWGLGGIAFVLVLLLMSTGIMLKFHYHPMPQYAYSSIQLLQHDVPFGGFIRNIHHWSANFLIVVVVLHLLRVFFTGAFHSPRQLNWIIGLCLLGFVILANFTGYLLPWDQLAYWAITICIGILEYLPVIGEELQQVIRRGDEIGASTLTLFFAIHTAVVPVGLILLLPFHFWRIRKAGGIITPQVNGENRLETTPVMPNLLLKELVVALLAIAVVSIVAAFWDAPLASKANPGLSPNPTKAPWYFIGFQELLMHFHPVAAAFVIPFMAGLTLVMLPYLKYETVQSGTWFLTPKGCRIAIISAATALVITPAGILLNEYVIDLSSWVPNVSPIIHSCLLPVILIMAGIAGFFILLKQKFRATVAEAVQGVFMFFLISFIILTITGIWFRGEGMAIIWPWFLSSPV